MGLIERLTADLTCLRGALRTLKATTPIAKNPTRVFPQVVAELAEKYGDAPALLSERERFIVQHRLMADDEVQLSLSDIGRRFGVSRERARQLEARAKAKLKRRLEEDAVIAHDLREEAA